MLFQRLREGRHRQALQTVDLVLIHVDTDVADDVGFDVAKVSADGPLSVYELIEAVRAQLIDIMGGAEDFELIQDRVVFAIAVDEVECWLLPLLFPNTEAKRKKTTGCFEAADHHLRTKKLPRLKKGEGKDIKGYEQVAKAYRKAKTLQKHRTHNPSLQRFIEALEAWRATQPT